jgi:hypothetical protein
MVNHYYKNLCNIYLAAHNELLRLEALDTVYAKVRIKKIQAILRVAEATIMEQLSIDLHIDPEEVETSYIDVVAKIGDWVPVHVCVTGVSRKWLAINLVNGQVQYNLG